jgi:hypothetical protein
VKALLISRDLLFISRIKEVASVSHGEVQVIKSEDALRAAVAEICQLEGADQRGVILLDLEKSPLELETVKGLVTALPTDRWRMISFFSHVHVEKAEQAKRLGLGDVLPRSKFVQILPGVFEG